MFFKNHTGPFVINKSATEIIYTYTDVKKGKVNLPKLYSIKKINGKWSKPELLTFCKKQNFYAHPALSDDENILFFTSDINTSSGTKDIYYSLRNGESWSEPVNCGNNINSEADECFPVFKAGYLYFASNKSGGFGKLDLYKAKFNTETLDFNNAQNLGPSINSDADDFGITFDNKKNYGFFSSNRVNKNDEIYFFTIHERAIVTSKNLSGNFTYRHLNYAAANLEVILMDETGNIISVSKTDEKGNFIFRELALEKNYYLKLKEFSDQDDIILAFSDENNNVVFQLMTDKQGNFVYRKLDALYSSPLMLMENDDPTSLTASISGQFIYENQPLRSYSDKEVLLIDDKGNIVAKTKTDKFGNFFFKELPLNKSYMIKTIDNENDIVMLLYNKENIVIAEYKSNNKGEYTYRRLNNQYSDLIRQIEEKDETVLLTQKTVSLFGYFSYKNTNDNPNKMRVMILDENDKILTRFVTDEKGYFRVKNLPIRDKYIFQIEENDPNISKSIYLNIISRVQKPLSLLENDNRGRFIYRKLKELYFELEDKDIIDNLSIVENYKLNMKIYFDYNKFTLDKKYLKDLDEIAKVMSDKTTSRLIIAGHADSRGTEQYNLTLSRKRAEEVKKYLLQKGIESHRTQVQFYGESKPSADCKNAKECDEYIHKENRRCELQFVY